MSLTINEATTQYGLPIGMDQRFWVRFDAHWHDAARVAYWLAFQAIPFTFDLLDDGANTEGPETWSREYEITTAPDDGVRLQAFLENFR